MMGGLSPRSRIDRCVLSSGLFGAAGPLTVNCIAPVAMPMHMALDAVCCTVRGGEGMAAFAKAFRPGALAPFTFGNAAAAARKAGEAGLAPALLAQDTEAEVLLFEALGDAWRPARVNDLRRPAAMQALAGAVAAWHEQPLLGSAVPLAALARDYAARVARSLAPSAAAPLPWPCPMPFPAMEAEVVRVLAALDAAGTDLAPTRGENTAANVMLGPDGALRLVDFDRAVDGDPLHDVGALCQELGCDDGERAGFVEMYMRHAPAAALARVRLYGLVDDFLWGCWGMAAETVPAMAGLGCFKYASTRFLRLAFNLQALDLDALRRAV